jgi:hypothetical protein
MTHHMVKAFRPHGRDLRSPTIPDRTVDRDTWGHTICPHEHA